EDVPQACNSNIGLSTARFNAGPPVRVTVISRAGDSKEFRPLGTSDETGTSIRSARNSTTIAVESGSISASPRPAPAPACPGHRSPQHATAPPRPRQPTNPRQPSRSPSPDAANPQAPSGPSTAPQHQQN